MCRWVDGSWYSQLVNAFLKKTQISIQIHTFLILFTNVWENLQCSHQFPRLSHQSKRFREKFVFVHSFEFFDYKSWTSFCRSHNCRSFDWKWSLINYKRKNGSLQFDGKEDTTNPNTSAWIDFNFTLAVHRCLSTNAIGRSAFVEMPTCPSNGAIHFRLHCNTRPPG